MYTACLVNTSEFLNNTEWGKECPTYKKGRKEGRKASCVGHSLCRNCLLKHVIDWKTEGRIKVRGRWGRRCEQLLNDLQDMKEYWKLSEEALACTLWGTHFGRGNGPVVRWTTDWMMNWVKHSSIVGVVTRLHAGQLRNHESIPSRGKKFFSSPVSRLVLGPPSCAFIGTRGSSPGGKATWAWSWPHLSMRLCMSGTILPIPHVISWHAQGHLHLIILKSCSCLLLSPLFDFQPSAYQCATNIIVGIYYLTSSFHMQQYSDF